MARALTALLLHAVLVCAALAAPPPRTLLVHPGERNEEETVPRRHAALGIEFLNHEIYGGLSNQMVFGESFEEASLASHPSQARARLCAKPSSRAVVWGC
jgi:hypothetical protein